MAGTCFERHLSWRVHCRTQARQMVDYSALDRSIILYISRLVLRGVCDILRSNLMEPIQNCFVASELGSRCDLEWGLQRVLSPRWTMDAKDRLRGWELDMVWSTNRRVSYQQNGGQA